MNCKISLDKRSNSTPFLQTRREVDLDAALAQAQQANVSLLTWGMPEYPSYLREIPNPPPLLYYQGELRGDVNGPYCGAGVWLIR
ncbi:MAG: hypothetical protein H6656_11675 [Ardenticatenaceae bacterium]|nr:hypothetical protein [Ardenticatenaceae bacterium]